MRVRMTTNIGGFRNSEPWPRKGEITDLPAHEAADLIQVGYAVAVEEDPHAPDPTPTPAPAPASGNGPDVPAAAPAPADAGDGGAPPAGEAPGPDSDKGEAGAAVVGMVHELLGLDKPALIALAAKHGIEVSGRWGEKRLRQEIAAALGG
jgi:hypothetical protein